MARNLKFLNWLVVTTLMFGTQAGTFHLKKSLQTTNITFPNGGFETNPTNPSNGWTWPASDWVWDGSTTHSGTHSARIYRGSGSETASIWSAYIPVQPSTVYTLTYWLRTQSATFWPSVNLYQYTSGYTQTGVRLIAHANITSGISSWNLVSYRFQTMPDASAIQVRIYLTEASGTFWFDDFGLEQGAPALYPFHPGFPVATPGNIYYNSPVVADINNDGANELLIASGSAVYGWDRNGMLLPNFPLITGDKRISCPLAVADLDGDGDLEIVAGTKTPIANGRGHVFIWHYTGELLNGWPQSVAWNTQSSHNSSLVSTVVLADINGDKALEILAGTSNNVAGAVNSGIAVPNLYAWHIDGSLVAGNWPNWYRSAGIYGLIAAGDLNGDGSAEVEVGRDDDWLNAYSGAGISFPGWPIETYLNGNAGNYNLDENIGYNIAAPLIADLDGDGQMEYIVAGVIGGPGYAPIHNSGLLVLEPDGTRRPGWETPALGNGVLDVDNMAIQAPAIADLNNDGRLEIIATTNDGWIRAYQADKTVLWAFNYTQGAVLEASEPVVGDIDGDGQLEVVFGTFVPGQPGGIYYNGPVGLWALKADGTVVPGFPLPIPTPGMLGAPTLADLDGDGRLEILVATEEGQVFAWDTLAPYDSTRLPWSTARNNLRRTGMYEPVPDFGLTSMVVSPGVAQYGETATFTIHIDSAVPVPDTITFTATIPSELSYIPGSAEANVGTVTITSDGLNWTGVLAPATTADITYKVKVNTTAKKNIANTIVMDLGRFGSLTRTVYLITNGFAVYLPLITRFR